MPVKNKINKDYRKNIYCAKKELFMKKGYNKRFGTIAVDKGYINENQLVKAMRIQAKENVKEDKHRLLGQIFVENGLLTNAQVDEILETMSQKIRFLRSAAR